MPITDDAGEILGMYLGFCEIEWPSTCSASEYISGIPFGNQTEENSLLYEDGFKGVRGDISEGHYLVFEANGHALSNPHDCKKTFGTSAANDAHDSLRQRWILHALAEEGTTFTISSAFDGRYISEDNHLTSNINDAAPYDIVYIGSSQYTLQRQSGKYVTISEHGSLDFASKGSHFNIWSVTYHN